MAYNTFNMRDPLQGYDIKVTATEHSGGNNAGESTTKRLVGRFNSFMYRVVSQTEAYLTLDERIPRMLDGEVIVVWSLDQGLVNPNVVENTFGKKFADAFAQGRGHLIPRQNRFLLKAEAGKGTTIHADTPIGETGFNVGDGTDLPKYQAKLVFCRVDTLTFGISPGKAVAANSWQGTAEGVDEG